MKKSASLCADPKSAVTESSPIVANSNWKKRIIVPIYSCALTIGVFDTLEELNGAAKKILPNESKWANCGAMSVFDGKGNFCVFFMREKRQINTNNIAHECLHVTYRIADGCGWGLCNETSEPFAYLHGWIASKVMEAIVDHGERIHG